jgi:hypothetical protein
MLLDFVKDARAHHKTRRHEREKKDGKRSGPPAKGSYGLISKDPQNFGMHVRPYAVRLVFVSICCTNRRRVNAHSIYTHVYTRKHTKGDQISSDP